MLKLRLTFLNESSLKLTSVLLIHLRLSPQIPNFPSSGDTSQSSCSLRPQTWQHPHLSKTYPVDKLKKIIITTILKIEQKIPAKHSIAAGVRQASTSHGSHSRKLGACGRFWASDLQKNKKTKKIISILSIFSADASLHLAFDKQDLEEGKMFSYVAKLELVQSRCFVHCSTDWWMSFHEENCWKVAWFAL